MSLANVPWPATSFSEATSATASTFAVGDRIRPKTPFGISRRSLTPPSDTAPGYPQPPAEAGIKANWDGWMGRRNARHEVKELGPGMTNDTIDHDEAGILSAVARLLHHAAVRAWAQAKAQGPRSPPHLLGLGIHAASCQVVAMLPAGTDLNGRPPAQDDVAQLLRAAEELARAIPVGDGSAGISMLVVAICDLVREATP
jgi:hypothetical protein